MIKTTIKKSLDLDKLVHLSHNDLDGIGCHMAMSDFYDDDPKLLSTQLLGKQFQDYLEMIIDLIISNDDDNMYTVLVTDIGEIDAIKLAKKYEKKNVSIIIVDHHVISNKEIINTPTEENTFGIDADIRFFGPTNLDTDKFKVCYIHNTKISATLLLANILGLTSVRYKWISDYDTGNWGEWRDDDTHTPSYPVKMNQALMSLRDVYKGYKDLNYVYLLNWYADLLEGKKLFPTNRDLAKAINRIVEISIRNNTKKYVEWTKNISIVDNPDKLYSTYTEDDTGKTIKKQIDIIFPNNIHDDKWWATIIALEKDDGSFSIYAKQYLEDNLDLAGLIKWTPKYKDIVSLRSARDDVNVQEIAALNGGGGHARAAGFISKPKVEYV